MAPVRRTNRGTASARGGTTTVTETVAGTENPEPPVENQPAAGGGGGGPPGGDGPGDGGGPPGGPPDQQPGAAVPPPAFSLTPGQAVRGIIDYETKKGRAYYGAATDKLEEELYDCEQEGFYQFIQSMKTRAEEFGWTTSLLRIPLTNEPNAEVVNLLEDFGRISLKRLTEYENEIQAAGQPRRINVQNREAQENRLLYECIHSSLSIQGKAKLNIHRDEYHVGNPELPSGLLYLKVLIRESYLDSNATTSMIRLKLSNLDSYIHTVGNDISKFNAHVKVLLDTLAARGETTQDLLTNLFKGYGACSDKKFVEYIGLKLSDYEEGKDLTSAELMNLALLKYKTLKSRDIWEAPSAEEEKLVAMEIRLQELQKKIASKRNKPSGDYKDGGKSRSGNESSRKKPKNEKPQWMFQKPKDDELYKPRQWKGRDWYFCGKSTGGKCKGGPNGEGQYRAHKPKDCKGKEAGKQREKNDKKVVINEAVEEIEGGYHE